MEGTELKKEIERKFLLEKMPDLSAYEQEDIIQGYLSYEPEIRIRKKGVKYFLTEKGEGDIERTEKETQIDKVSFMILLNLVKGNIIEKTRYQIPLDNNLTAEFDIYHDALEGLFTIEVEFESKEIAEAFKLPIWFGEDVTSDKRYKNKNLAKCEDMNTLLDLTSGGFIR